MNDNDAFACPPAAWRGTPFWSWNDRLDRGRLLRQIALIRAMGFGGFVMHSRTGLDTAYLGAEFLEHVKACVRQAHDLGLQAWLYDEDRWPSGYGGGLVTADPRYRQRFLLWTQRAYPADRAKPTGEKILECPPKRTEQGNLLACYEVVLTNGCLTEYRRLAGHTSPTSGRGRIWHAYLEVALPCCGYNNQTKVDTLNPEAARRFLDITHERYREIAGEYFGKTIPAIFTDEAAASSKGFLSSPEAMEDIQMPFTDDLPASFHAAYGADLLDHLPELFWELPGGRASRVRYWFYEHVRERLAHGFYAPLSCWCRRHGLPLAGHLMEESSLENQTRSMGEMMRFYPYFDIPGIDCLGDTLQLTTAKQVQSAARQLGRGRVLSELYGATGWEFAFSDHKAQGDWQAALGVTHHVHHLAWYSMRGEAKRDYPASIFYQAPWWQEYRLIEDHFARVHMVMSRGRPLTRAAVIHPIESYWLACGPMSQTRPERDRREREHQDLAQWLLHGLIDFDYAAESLLAEDADDAQDAIPTTVEKAGGEKPLLRIGHMAYETVLVPGLRTIRSRTLDLLEKFADAGGQVLFLGKIPSLENAAPSDRPAKLAARCRSIPLEKQAVLAELDGLREINASQPDGTACDALLHQMRVEGDKRWLFVCNTDRSAPRRGITLKLHGHWQAFEMDTLTGGTRGITSHLAGPCTEITHDFPAHGHLLLELRPAKCSVEIAAPPDWSPLYELSAPAPVTISEPNVLVMDQAEWRWNEEAWNARDEILRIDDAVRSRLGLLRRRSHLAQPWVDAAPLPIMGCLSLRFTIYSEANIAAPKLGLEDFAAQIELDGTKLPAIPDGRYIDEAIQTIPLPPLAAGRHVLTLTIPYHRKTMPEHVYLLGDFGVAVDGRQARIIAPPRTLSPEDWTKQGLPFYGGNVTYHYVLDMKAGAWAVQAKRFRCPLLSAALDGERKGTIAFAPFIAELGRVTPGPHSLDLTVFGNRVNTLGALHATGEGTASSPSAWRTEGLRWSYDYHIRPCGLLAPPLLLGHLHRE